MKEIGIESEGSKGSRVMVERSNKIMTIGLALHMVKGMRNIAVSVGGRMMRGNMRGWGEGRVEGSGRMVSMGVVVALRIT